MGHTATDVTGKVHVVVDAQGRVAEVRIDQRWRNWMDPHQLMSTLLNTYHSARHQAGAAITAQRVSGSASEVAQPDVETGSSAREHLWPLGPDAGHEERWRRIRDIWTEFRAGRERRAQIVVTAGQTRRITGPHGYLTATVKWNVVVDITGDSRAIAYASTDQLRQDALAILAPADQSPRT